MLTNKLRNMLLAVGVVTLGGIGFKLSTPQPAARSMPELRDAGLNDGQKFALICPERLTQRTKNRVNRIQPSVLRPKQSYARVARLAVCFNPDGGNCFRPSDGLLRVASLEGEIIVPSLHRDTEGTVEGDDGGEGEIDDSLQFRLDDCSFLTCNQADIAQDAGTFLNPYANPFCGALNRIALQPLPCMIPDGRLPDGGFLDDAPEGQIDCKFTGPYGTSDGGARWNGINVRPKDYAIGSQCLPVECSVVAGDVPGEWL